MDASYSQLLRISSAAVVSASSALESPLNASIERSQASTRPCSARVGRHRDPLLTVGSTSGRGRGVRRCRRGFEHRNRTLLLGESRGVVLAGSERLDEVPGAVASAPPSLIPTAKYHIEMPVYGVTSPPLISGNVATSSPRRTGSASPVPRSVEREGGVPLGERRSLRFVVGSSACTDGECRERTGALR